MKHEPSRGGDRLRPRHEAVSGTRPGAPSRPVADGPCGRFCVLVGPSGGGKTTALKMVNRLIPFDEGDIGSTAAVSATAADRAAARDRLRDPAVGLFPHMTVGDNVATVPRCSAGKARIAAGAELLELVGLERGDGPRYPPAVGRAAPARRAGARARGRPAGAADGRAVRRRRPDHPRGCRTSCGASTAGSARRSSSSPTTSTRRSGSATGSRSSARAACSRSTTRPTRSSRTRPTSSSRSSSARTGRCDGWRCGGSATSSSTRARRPAGRAVGAARRRAERALADAGRRATRSSSSATTARRAACCGSSASGAAAVTRRRRRPGDPELRRAAVRPRRPHVLLGLGAAALGRHAQPALLQHLELTRSRSGSASRSPSARAAGAAVPPARASVRRRRGAPLHDPEPRALPAARPVHGPHHDDDRGRARRLHARDPPPEHRRRARAAPAEVLEAARGMGHTPRQILTLSSCRSPCRRSSAGCGSRSSRRSPSRRSPRS